MGTMQDHRRCAEECVAMARQADDDNDKALWLTLAQSWVRLADHVARASADLDPEADEAFDDEAEDELLADDTPGEYDA
jgi:hypothetical protein